MSHAACYMKHIQIHCLFFFLLILFLPTQLGFHFWPDWALVLGRRIDYLSPTLFFSDILLTATIVSWIFERKPQIISKHAFMVGLMIVAFAFVNIYFAQRPFVSIYKWIKFTEFLSLIFYINREKPLFSVVASALTIAILYSSLLAIAQTFLGHSVGGPWWFLGERFFTGDMPGVARSLICVPGYGCQLWLRPYATFPHPNVLGGFLVISLYLLCVWRLPHWFRLTSHQRILFLSSTGLGVVTLFLTFSRSAWLAGVGLLLVAIRLTPSIYYKKILFGLWIFLCLGIVLYLSKITTGDESIVARSELNTVALKLWQKSPFIGIGLGNYVVALPSLITVRSVYFLQPVHNIYLLVLSETGAVGSILCLLLIRKAVSNKREAKSKTKNWSHVACLMPFVTLLFLGLFDHYFLTLQQGQLLASLLLGLTTYPPSRRVT